METTVLIAIITLIGSTIGSMIANNKTEAVMGEQLRQLRAEVEKHNQLVERMYKVEKDLNTAFLLIDEIKHNK